MSRMIRLICFVFAGGVTFFYTSGFRIDGPIAGSQIKDDYTKNLEAFVQSCETLNDKVKQLKTKDDVAELQQTFLNTRRVFRQVELLMAYFDQEAYLKTINGAPLLKIEKKAPELVVLEPKGLQVLDELIFGESPFAEVKTIANLTEKLLKDVTFYKKVQSGLIVNDHHVFEASRQAVLRLFTLILTGFDTPASGNTMEEAKLVLISIKDLMQFYEKYAVKQLGSASFSIYEKAILYLDEHSDFDSFDRLDFLKSFLDPIYSHILALQKDIGIELPHEIYDLPQAVNYNAEQLFDNDFLNPFYYSKLNKRNFSQAKVKLGRQLFFDPILSKDNKQSCASCHRPELAFTDGLAKSKTRNLGTVDRNSPTIINAVYSERYFYDLRVEKLEKQVEHVIFNEKEFNTSYKEITRKINEKEHYKESFETAFPNHKKAPVSSTIAEALASFIQEKRGFNSPFDQFVRGESETLNESAKRGFNIFMGKATCGTCHFPPTFNGTVPPLYKDSESEVLGVPKTSKETELDPDLGRYANKRPKEHAEFNRHAFKTSSVRNVKRTAPYMHNGAYQTLEEVVNFYNKGGGLGLGFDIPNQTLPGDSLNLSQQEIKDLVSFMESLENAEF